MNARFFFFFFGVFNNSITIKHYIIKLREKLLLATSVSSFWVCFSRSFVGYLDVCILLCFCLRLSSCFGFFFFSFIVAVVLHPFDGFYFACHFQSENCNKNNRRRKQKIVFVYKSHFDFMAHLSSHPNTSHTL